MMKGSILIRMLYRRWFLFSPYLFVTSGHSIGLHRGAWDWAAQRWLQDGNIDCARGEAVHENQSKHGTLRRISGSFRRGGIVMEAGKRQIDTRTTPHRTTKKAWVGCGIVIVGLGAAGWWFVKPPPAETASGSGVLATAPASSPQPLNADGAPRSD
jgi:hypothetical protein